jgi:hypothetical protein
MPHYRLYYIDGAGSIASVEEFSARDDVEAVRVTRDGGAKGPRELWCRARMVEALEAGQRHAAPPA